MFVAAWMNRLPSSIATKGPQEKAPSTEASAVPKITGIAAAVRLNGRESLNHSAAVDRKESTTRPPSRQPTSHDRPSVPAPTEQFWQQPRILLREGSVDARGRNPGASERLARGQRVDKLV